MNMLKHVLAFFAFILVSLASVYADEGYIPYFPDALEPDGIGFRGPAEIIYRSCMTGADIKDGDCYDDTPIGVPYSEARSSVLASPITIEYKKNYLYKRLLYFGAFVDFASSQTNMEIRRHSSEPGNDPSYRISEIASNPFLQGFLTAEEKSKLSSLDSSRIFDLKTKSNFILSGVGLGVDLWFLEIYNGFFLMYHDTTVSLRSCKFVSLGYNGDPTYQPSKCQINPDDIINLDEQNYSGFAYGFRNQVSLVFLQTDNWRIAVESSSNNIAKIYDSSFTPIKYRGLNFYSGFTSQSKVGCRDDNIISSSDDSGNIISKRTHDCRNSQGQNLSESSDYTMGLQITYYFR